MSEGLWSWRILIGAILRALAVALPLTLFMGVVSWPLLGLVAAPLRWQTWAW